MIPSLQAELEILGADPETFEGWYSLLDEVINKLARSAERQGDEPITFYAAAFLAATARGIVFAGREGKIASAASVAFRMFRKILEQEGDS